MSFDLKKRYCTVPHGICFGDLFPRTKIPANIA